MVNCGKTEFDANSKDCLSCEKNLKCLSDFVTKLGCKLGNICSDSENRYNGTCSAKQGSICAEMYEFRLAKAQADCDKFGFPGEKSLEECLLCDLQRFRECESWNLSFRNLDLTKDEGRKIYEEELETFKFESGSCLGRFHFLDSCWKECDYWLECMRMTGIRPQKDCVFFPDVLEIKQTSKLRLNCSSCKLSEKCSGLLNEMIEATIRKQEEKKLFRNFYSIEEIRGTFMED